MLIRALGVAGSMRNNAKQCHKSVTKVSIPAFFVDILTAISTFEYVLWLAYRNAIAQLRVIFICILTCFYVRVNWVCVCCVELRSRLFMGIFFLIVNCALFISDITSNLDTRP